jgi:hypothetical protein
MMKHTLLILLAISLTSCLPARVAARTASDLAEDLCRQYYAERVGLNWEDVGRKFCSTHDDVKPFLDVILAQKRALDETAVGLKAQKGAP